MRTVNWCRRRRAVTARSAKMSRQMFAQSPLYRKNWSQVLVLLCRACLRCVARFICRSRRLKNFVTPRCVKTKSELAKARSLKTCRRTHATQVPVVCAKKMRRSRPRASFLFGPINLARSWVRQILRRTQSHSIICGRLGFRLILKSRRLILCQRLSSFVSSQRPLATS